MYISQTIGSLENATKTAFNHITRITRNVKTVLTVSQCRSGSVYIVIGIELSLGILYSENRTLGIKDLH